ALRQAACPLLVIPPPPPAPHPAPPPPISVGRHLKGDLLNRVSQLHLLGTGLGWLGKPIVPGSTHLCCSAEPGYRFAFFPDLRVDGPPPPSASYCSSKTTNSFFRKSFSIVSWPIFRSSSASRLSTSIRLPRPENALVGCSWNSRRHRWSTLGLISSRRAT